MDIKREMGPEEPEEIGGVSLHKLRLLEALEEEPQVRQMDLAVRLGVAIGTVNWHLKRLAAKGYIEVRKIGRWRWSYILTPKGLAEKARLTRAYISQSMRLYRETRERARELLREVKQAGYRRVRIEGDSNDLVDVCRLTCLEQGVEAEVASSGSGSGSGSTSAEGEGEGEGKAEEELPILRVDGRVLTLEWPEGHVTQGGKRLR